MPGAEVESIRTVTFYVFRVVVEAALKSAPFTSAFGKTESAIVGVCSCEPAQAEAADAVVVVIELPGTRKPEFSLQVREIRPLTTF
jgi:hypothetical protein